MNTTDKEFALLDKIIHDEFQPSNGATPKCFEETGSIWAFCIESQSEGGVLSSLMKKGLVDHFDDGEDSTVRITKEGFAAWQEVNGAA